MKAPGGHRPGAPGGRRLGRGPVLRRSGHRDHAGHQDVPAKTALRKRWHATLAAPARKSLTGQGQPAATDPPRTCGSVRQS